MGAPFRNGHTQALTSDLQNQRPHLRLAADLQAHYGLGWLSGEGIGVEIQWGLLVQVQTLLTTEVAGFEDFPGFENLPAT